MATPNRELNNCRDIQIEGYTPVFPNYAYLKNDHLLVGNDYRLPVTYIALLERFTQAIVDDVVALVKKTAISGLQSRSFNPQYTPQNPLEDAILNLPDVLLRGILEEEDSLMGFIRENMPLPAKISGSMHYLLLRFGCFPAEMIDELKAPGRTTDADCLDHMLSNPLILSKGYGERCQGYILLENGSLPARSKIGVLLREIEESTFSTKSLKIYGDTRFYPEIIQIIKGMYSKPTPSLQLEEIPDTSEMIIFRAAFTSVMALHYHLAMQNMQEKQGNASFN